uniref:Coiled-coil domain-containing protein 47 n=1 Tax=Chenopodium quinoa TaxID=63459 RepID=A0A803N847_CHEQI
MAKRSKTSQYITPTHHGPPPPSDPKTKESHSYPKSEYWDEDEFEGLPVESHQEYPEITEGEGEGAAVEEEKEEDEFVAKTQFVADPKSLISVYSIEIACVSFLIVFGINYFSGKKENENLALAWAAKFATKDTIFEKNFSLLGVGEGEDSPLLLKEGQNVFKFYASGRRYCQGLLATLELKSRHDLISRVYYAVVPTKDEITFEVYMNDEAMDQVVFAVARKKAAKTMLKELPDLQRFASLMPTPSNKKWLSEDLSVVSESKEVASDLITEVVIDQVLGEKAFEKLGKYFISMHFSDQHSGVHKKKLMFKFALPNHKNMADMTRLVALVPYYIDLVGRYKLSSQARSKTDAARVKAAQEAYKELQNARQENLQRKKADRRKMMEEAEAKLSAEAIRKKEAKERTRQMKKAGPKMKMTRAH